MSGITNLYKIVLASSDGVLRSTSAPPPMQQIYNIGQWHTPRFGKFFCYRSIEAATFLQDTYNEIIFHVLAYGVEEKPPSITLTSRYWAEYWEAFYQNNLHTFLKETAAVIHPAPPGTLLVDRVMLLEPVRGLVRKPWQSANSQQEFVRRWDRQVRYFS